MKSIQVYQQPKNEINLLDPRDFIPLWIEYLKLRERAKEISPDTISGYKKGISKFLDWIKENPTPDSIREWKASLLEEKYKPSTINAWLSGTRSFFKWLAETNRIQFDPAALITGVGRKGMKNRHSRPSLTNSEVISLIDCPDRETVQGKRDYAIIMLMLYTAIRGISIYRAEIDDLGTEHGKTILHIQGKGHIEKDSILVLPPEADEAVRDWLSVRGQKQGALFTSLSRRSFGKPLQRRSIRWMVKKYILRSGIIGKNKTVHSLRHTAITSAIQHGAPLEKVMGMSGHTSMDTLMIYYHEIDRVLEPAEEKINYEGR